MTVTQYREWIGHVRVSLAEFVNAETEETKLIGALRVDHNVRCLERAECSQEKVREQATFWIRRAKNRLSEEGFQKIVEQWQNKDAMITKLAFAKEWK